MLHASGHIMNVNSQRAGAGGLAAHRRRPPRHAARRRRPADRRAEGPRRDDAGRPARRASTARCWPATSPACATSRGCACAQGVTTATDLANPLPRRGRRHDAARHRRGRLSRRASCRCAACRATPRPTLVARALALRAASTDRLRLGLIKIVVDGSIQGFSARLRWPGYYNGAPNGLWYMAPEQMRAVLRAGARSTACRSTRHTNGDEATELVLDCMEQALREHPARDHRFTLQHCQLADAAQFRRMKALGMCVNLFANHHFYWGDQHYAHDRRPGARRAHERLRHRAGDRRAAGHPFATRRSRRSGRCSPPGARCNRLHRERPRARRARAHRRRRRAAHHHAGRGLHAQARRRDRLDRMRQARRFRRARGRPAGDRRRAR